MDGWTDGRTDTVISPSVVGFPRILATALNRVFPQLKIPSAHKSHFLWVFTRCVCLGEVEILLHTKF
jgi:hypothetical protein